MSKKVAFYTLGCKVNQYETDAMEDMLKDTEYEIVDFIEVADIYIINTCTVTAVGDKKSRHIINKAKAQNKNAKIIVTGCMAQELKENNETLSNVDLLVGVDERKDILNIIRSLEIKNECFGKEFWGRVLEKKRTRAYIKIEDGCDMFCTYCIIPYVRGRVRSRIKEDVIAEIKGHIKKGAKEIVLIGIHLASYGKDLKATNLIDLLTDIEKIEGDFRIRLGSLEPNFISKTSVDKMKQMKRLCKHFHLSLQSASNDILKKMNRKYTIEEFKQKVGMLRQAFTNVSITTDIIVGFPGETEELFNETCKNLEYLKLNKLHVFPYSKRQGTVACDMPNQISESIKNNRVKKVIDISNRAENEYKKFFIGKDIDVILENRLKNGLRMGYSEEYLNVFVDFGEAGDRVIIKGTKENLSVQ